MAARHLKILGYKNVRLMSVRPLNDELASLGKVLVDFCGVKVEDYSPE